MDSGASGSRELKAVLYALQFCGITYDVLPIYRISDCIDTTKEAAGLKFIADFFSFIQLT
jgi:hypothetical protein